MPYPFVICTPSPLVGDKLGSPIRTVGITAYHSQNSGIDLLYIRCSEYVLYVLYACKRIQLASPAESGMTIILERLCISPTGAIRQGGGPPYMQQDCYDMEVGENRVRVFYGTEKREGERLEIYGRDISPCNSHRVSDL